jgi:hypothetical protein
MGGTDSGNPHQSRGRGGSPACPGVLRIVGSGSDSCSLGRHCEANALMRDRDAYRSAHHRFSDTSVSASTGAASSEWREEPTLMDLIVDAMRRLDRLNPPTE